MNGDPHAARPAATRGRRWIGAVLLANFVVVCAIKISAGVGGEALWLSHVALLMAGLGLLLHIDVLWIAALTAIGIPHMLWLVDCLSWAVLGRYPLAVTQYLADAKPAMWIATLHHFYLLPLLLGLACRVRALPWSAFPLAAAVYLALTVVSRAALGTALNVNYAFGVRVSLAPSLVDAFNRLPGGLYLLSLNALMSGMMFLPTTLLLRHAHRSLWRDDTLGRQKRCSTPVL